MARPSFVPRMDGFTLLEIMVALAIFATLATAVLSAGQYVVKQAGAAEQRLIAAWVADNQLNELRLQPGRVIGQSQRVVQMDRRDWVVRHHIRAASDERLYKVDVEVSLAGREQTVHRASGWIAQPHE
ncbi:type II secretion system minor pseudopilin GspI [Pseudomonas izuensis]|uniref:type II secretion system minor pseudopilin GspI n=1 Tax=Pseudomonas izuensis TaxID=2684212 RepID=UPI00135A6FD1|nr:type II secretion system minor pseudopilin GspI [Pseudomonas izuensis]